MRLNFRTPSGTLCVTVLIAAASQTSLQLAAADKPAPPNVLILLADDVGYGDLGCYGSPARRSDGDSVTPHLDRLAAEGVRYSQAYAASPVCSPSRCGIITGRFPARSGLYGITSNEMGLAPEAATLAKRLAAAGYETMMSTKWHLSSRNDRRSAREYGFDVVYPNSADPAESFADWQASRTDKQRPWFAYVCPHETHVPTPEQCPREFWSLFDSEDARRWADEDHFGWVPKYNQGVRTGDPRNYLGALAVLDAAVGRIREALTANGHDDGDTIVLFASDNGPEHNGKWSFGRSGPLRGAKRHLYEGGVRVPLIAWSPGRIVPRECHDVVSLIDLHATSLAVAGVAIPDDCDGLDLAPTWGDGGSLRRTDPLYWSLWHAYGGTQHAIRAGNWKLHAQTAPLPRPRGRAAEGESVQDWILHAPVMGWKLFDLATDPSESHDRAAQEPERMAELQTLFWSVHRSVLDGSPVWTSLEETRASAVHAWPPRDWTDAR